MVLVRVAVVAVVASSACARTHTAGFWFEDGALTLPDAVAARLGGPLTDGEIVSIKQLSRAEIDRAFSGLTISITESEGAFWRVVVLRSLPNRGNKRCRMPANHLYWTSAWPLLRRKLGDGAAR